jgi:glycosyltransferase involved in cell wall biosynthesis
MNILFISHENALNGANKSMLNLIDTLTLKYNFFVWCREGSEGPFINELNARGIAHYDKCFCFSSSYQPKGKLGLLRRKLRWHLKEKKHNINAVDEISDFIKSNNINIIHINSSIIDIGVQLKQKYGIPLVWHIREFGKEDFGWVPLCSEKKYYKNIKENADAVITISKAVEAKYKGHLNDNQLYMIYNGIPSASQVKKNNYNINSNSILTFLQTGVLCEAKGQNLAIDAMRILKDRGYSNIKLLLAGRGNLADISENIKIDDLNVELLGQVNNMNEIRALADVELVCSKAEAFGRVTIEAMMCGIPVIGANTGGTPELIEDGKNGLVFERTNPNKMEFLYLNRELIEKMGKYAANYALNNFDINICASKVADVYDSIAKKGTLKNEY